MENGKEKILDRLQKIKAHADSAEKIGSVEEAQAFAEMLQRLLLKHNLEMTDLEFEAHEKDEPIDRFTINWEDHGLKTKKCRIEWEERLASIVARANLCRILVHVDSNRITLVGRKSDIQVAEYLIVTLRRSAKKISFNALNEFIRENKKNALCEICYKTKDLHVFESHDFLRTPIVGHEGFRASFMTAFVSRIQERLEETKKVVTSSSTALVRINRAEANLMEFMNQFGRAKGKALGSVNGNSNAEGWRRGRAAADSVNIKGNAFSGDSSKMIS